MIKPKNNNHDILHMDEMDRIIAENMDAIMRVEDFRAMLRGIVIQCIREDLQGEFCVMIDQLSESECEAIREYVMFPKAIVFNNEVH